MKDLSEVRCHLMVELVLLALLCVRFVVDVEVEDLLEVWDLFP